MITFNLPTEQSDMSDFDETATIVVSDEIIHFSSAIPEMFAVETFYDISYELSEAPGEWRTRRSSSMSGVMLADQIVRFSAEDPDTGDLAWVRCILNGLACFVRISLDSPGSVDFMRMEADSVNFGWSHP